MIIFINFRSLWPLVVSCVLLLPLFTNCTYRDGAFTDYNTLVEQQESDTRIQVEELLGTWSFNELSLERIDRLKKIGLTKVSSEENTIEIAKDGTCRFNTYTAFHPLGNHLISEGRWSLKKEFDHGLRSESWQIEFDLRPTDNHLVKTYFYLKRKSGRLTMYTFIEDPDQNEFVELERRSVATHAR